MRTGRQARDVGVTDRIQIHAAVDTLDALDILMTNAGVSVPDDLNNRSAFERPLGNQAHASVLLQALSAGE
jgi:NADP-dependent 3-hydroxy acid dehydrogenase YdfG